MADKKSMGFRMGRRRVHEDWIWQFDELWDRRGGSHAFSKIPLLSIFDFINFSIDLIF